jgi:hypothetical protein
MASKGQMTGMLGAYLAAAELTNKGLIVSLTSRNDRGADLLVTDQAYARTWSIQVKTNRKATSYWLLNADYKAMSSPTHVYIFLNLHGAERPDYYIVPSKAVAKYGGGNGHCRPRSVSALASTQRRRGDVTAQSAAGSAPSLVPCAVV